MIQLEMQKTTFYFHIQIRKSFALVLAFDCKCMHFLPDMLESVYLHGFECVCAFPLSLYTNKKYKWISVYVYMNVRQSTCVRNDFEFVL